MEFNYALCPVIQIYLIFLELSFVYEWIFTRKYLWNKNKRIGIQGRKDGRTEGPYHFRLFQVLFLDALGSKRLWTTAALLLMRMHLVFNKLSSPDLILMPYNADIFKGKPYLFHYSFLPLHLFHLIIGIYPLKTIPIP
jgi:hypothetical protein